MSFRIEGLDQLSAALGKAARDKAAYNELRYEVGKRHLVNCAKTCGEDSGQLRDSFERRDWKDQKEWILFADIGETVEAGTKVWYARLVEEGHRNIRATRIKMKNGRVRRKKKDLGFVAGTHFMRRALEQTNRDIPEMVEKFIGKLGKEAGFDVTK